MPIPNGLSYAEAAAIPEVYMTAYLNLFYVGNAKAGETLLMNAGASGLASAVIPMAKAFGLRVITTVLGEEKVKEVAYLNGYGATTQVGENLLNGRWAREYSRIRRIDSDFGRTNRQRTVMNALFQAYKDMPISDIPGMLSKVLPMVSTDLSDSQMINYATKVLMMGVDTINSNSVPCKGAYEYQTIRKMSIIMPDLEKCHEALKHYIYGEPYNP
jgi:anionic cell wall polymer biosynthesis LytR-Cps2A-Psr (LCP) family protein